MHYGMLEMIVMQINNAIIASFQYIFKSIESDWIIVHNNSEIISGDVINLEVKIFYVWTLTNVWMIEE